MTRRKTALTIPVSRRALVARVNRHLAKAGETLKATRGDRLREVVGHYYRLDTRADRIVEQDVDLATFAATLGLLAPYERLEE